MKNQPQHDGLIEDKEFQILCIKRQQLRGNFICLKKHSNKLQKKLGFSKDQIEALQFEFSSYREFKNWFKAQEKGLSKLHYTELQVSDREIQQNENQINYNQLLANQINLQNNQNQNANLNDTNQRQSYNEISTKFGKEINEVEPLQIFKQLKQSQSNKEHDTFKNNQDALNQYENIKLIERQIQELVKKLKAKKEIDLSSFQTYSHKILKDQDFLKGQEQRDEESSQEFEDLDRQVSDQKDFQKFIQPNIPKSKYTLRLFEWGMRQKINDSTQYQGNILDQRLWDRVLQDNLPRASGNRFDVILTDAPWGDTAIKLGYNTLSDIECTRSVPIDQLQKNGYVFMWVTNKKLEIALEYLKSINYERIEMITWIKISKEKLLKDAIGFYLRHFTEFCIVAKKIGSSHKERALISKTHKAPNIIVAEVRESSHKPDQIYQIIETLVPNGKYLEVFGRDHNQRNGWTTVGNESIRRKKPRQQKFKDKMLQKNLKDLIRLGSIEIQD